MSGLAPQRPTRAPFGVLAVAALAMAASAGACRPDQGSAQGGPTAGGSGDARSSPRHGGPSAAQNAVPEMVVPALRADDRIEVDGLLTEEAWQRAGSTGPLVNVGTGRAVKDAALGGQARMLWDPTGFYLGFEVRDRAVRGGFPTDVTDPHLWERDTIEVMLDPDGDGDNRDYYEIQVNPQNLVFDSQFDGYNQPRGGAAGPFGHEQWSARLRSAVQIRGTLDDDTDVDEGYTVELWVPWTSFGKARRAPPAAGDRWRANLYAMQDNGGVAWSPILGQGNFHRASRFGRLEWGGAASP